MDKFALCNMIGWVFLILSWVLPIPIKESTISRMVGMSLSAIALGIFITNGIYKFL